MEVQQEIKGHIALVQAHLQRKSDLLHQKGDLKMRHNYYRSSPFIKDSKELARVSKLITSRLAEAVSSKSDLSKLDPKEFTKFKLGEIIATESLLTVTEKEAILNDTKDAAEKTQSLNKRLEYLLRTLREKKTTHIKNQIRIKQNSRILASTGKDQDISLKTTENSAQSSKRREKHQSMARTDSTHDSFGRVVSHHKSLSSLSLNNLGLDALSSSFRLVGPKSIKNLKAYLDLSESAALLLSKQSMMFEMRQCVDTAEKELTRKLDVSRKKIKKFKALGLDKDVSFVLNENQIIEMERKIRVLEKEVEDSRQERDFMEYISNVGLKFQEFEDKRVGFSKKFSRIESLHDIDLSKDDNTSFVEEIEIIDREISNC